MLSMNKLFLRLFIVSTLVITVSVAVLYSYVQQQLHQQVSLESPASQQQAQQDSRGRVIWTIERGSNLSQVNRQLYLAGILSSPVLLARYARLKGDVDIQAGSYWISLDDSASSLLNKFNRGEVVRYQITFPEGWAFKHWLAHLQSVPQFAGISGSTPEQLLAQANIDVEYYEGWFFPDTYSYSATDSVADILAQAHARMLAVLKQAWERRELDLPYSSAYEALIMASIIEKETGLAEEQEEIAGVFVRRMRSRMRLQTDPTVIYGMGDAYKGNIRRVHLKQRTPYNTYMINGLPPTPIAMPSEAAIEAALHPLPGSSLYFVARGDGGHYFSDTLEEHLGAVRQYQIKQRAHNYQSAPQQNSD